MANKRHKPDEIVTKLRQVEVLACISTRLMTVEGCARFGRQSGGAYREMDFACGRYDNQRRRGNQR